MNSKSTGNVFFEIHSAFSKLALNFREMVSEECNFSVPTFYRKMKAKDKKQGNRTIPAISNAEETAIFKIAKAVVAEITAFMARFPIK
ncbi:hypothetical protein [Chitinophaga sp. MM2321]|uniref:hypothetical protein n=1 Tax=Chitinophaga sp. MM2321 TaxID=3137178 RepID=UPI0032D5691F